MIAATHMKGQRVAVFGLGRSGLSAALSCLAGGAEVVAWDDNDTSRVIAEKNEIPISNLIDIDFEEFDALVLAPGVPLTHPAPHWTVQKAEAANVPIIGDTELFVRQIKQTDAKLIAITGTNGKSTTTALIGHICDQHVPTQIGGNIGVPVLELDPFSGPGVYVIEFSSYQIDLTPSLKPDIAVCLNISPDHLDRHGNMQHYAEVKAKIFSLQSSGDTAILGADDAYCRAISSEFEKPDLVTISGVHLTQGVSVLNGTIFRGGDEIAKLGLIKTLLGNHNAENIAASFAAASALGMSDAQIIAALQTFPGLAHRMEYLGSRGMTDFMNDSKATNVDAASKALSSLKNIHWIAGGLEKEGGIKPLLEFVPHISHAYLIGSSAESFKNILHDQLPTTICKTMAEAVQLAANNAEGEKCKNVVLLSPAAASFDHYKSFEERGNDFKNQVYTLQGFTPAGERG